MSNEALLTLKIKARIQLRRVFGEEFGRPKHSCGKICDGCFHVEYQREKYEKQVEQFAETRRKAEEEVWRERGERQPNFKPAKWNPNREYAASFLDLPGEVRNQIYGLLRKGAWIDVLDTKLRAIEKVHPKITQEWQSLGFGGKLLIFNVRNIPAEQRAMAWHNFYQKVVTQKDATKIQPLWFCFPHFTLKTSLSHHPFRITLTLKMTSDRYKSTTYLPGLAQKQLNQAASELQQTVGRNRALEGNWVLHRLGVLAFKLVVYMHLVELPEYPDPGKHAWGCKECAWAAEMAENGLLCADL